MTTILLSGQNILRNGCWKTTCRLIWISFPQIVMPPPPKQCPQPQQISSIIHQLNKWSPMGQPPNSWKSSTLQCAHTHFILHQETSTRTKTFGCRNVLLQTHITAEIRELFERKPLAFDGLSPQQLPNNIYVENIFFQITPLAMAMLLSNLMHMLSSLALMWQQESSRLIFIMAIAALRFGVRRRTELNKLNKTARFTNNTPPILGKPGDCVLNTHTRTCTHADTHHTRELYWSLRKKCAHTCRLQWAYLFIYLLQCVLLRVSLHREVRASHTLPLKFFFTKQTWWSKSKQQSLSFLSPVTKINDRFQKCSCCWENLRQSAMVSLARTSPWVVFVWVGVSDRKRTWWKCWWKITKVQNKLVNVSDPACVGHRWNRQN